MFGLFALFHFTSIQNKMRRISKKLLTQNSCDFSYVNTWVCVIVYTFFFTWYTVVLYFRHGQSGLCVWDKTLSGKDHGVQFTCIYVAFLTMVNVANELFWVCCIKSQWVSTKLAETFVKLTVYEHGIVRPWELTF